MAFPLSFSPPLSILPYSLMETRALAQGKALLQSTGLKVCVKISSSRIELWHLTQLQGLFGVLKNCIWVIKRGVQPPLIPLACISIPALQQEQGTPLRKLGYLHWLKVAVVLAHQRVSKGVLERLHCKSILYPLTYHFFPEMKLLMDGKAFARFLSVRHFK